MTVFEYITIIASIILGLGLSRLLSEGIDLFRFREKVDFSWVPLVWALSLVWLAIIFWWQLFDVGVQKEVWLFTDFFLLIVFVLLYFCASSLVLPKHYMEERIDLFVHFDKEGRWGVVAYSALFLVAIFVNNRLFDSPIVSMESLMVLIMAVLALATFFSKRKQVAEIVTGVFIALLIIENGYVLIPTFSE